MIIFLFCNALYIFVPYPSLCLQSDGCAVEILFNVWTTETITVTPMSTSTATFDYYTSGKPLKDDDPTILTGGFQTGKGEDLRAFRNVVHSSREGNEKLVLMSTVSRSLSTTRACCLRPSMRARSTSIMQTRSNRSTGLRSPLGSKRVLVLVPLRS